MLNKNDIKHGFGTRSHDLVGLFAGVNKLSSFMNKLEKQSLADPDRYDSDKYKGDGFEFLVEIFLKSHACDNRIGITNYEPVQSDDNGVDGIGVNLSGDKCVVQVKYRSNKQSLLTTNKDHLGNMIVEAQFKYDINKPVDNTKVPRYYVITTANGLHHYTDNDVFKGYVYCLGYDQLRSMLDNNLSFWNLCRKLTNEINGK